MQRRVVITGLGTISAIGDNVEQTLDSLLYSRSGVGKISILETALSQTHPAAEIKKTNADLKLQAGLPADGYFSRTMMLGLIAAKEAVSSARIENIGLLRTGLISATSVGGM